MRYNCSECKKIIVIDIETYLKKNPGEKWIQCTYCGLYLLTDKIKKEMKK